MPGGQNLIGGISTLSVVSSTVGPLFNFGGFQVERFAHPVFLLSGLILPLHGLCGQEEVLRQPVVRLATYNVHGGLEASAAAVGSVMILLTSSPAILPASFVAWRWLSLK